jgi:hypothetical protein
LGGGFAASTSSVFLPVTGWYSTNGMSKIRFVTEVRSNGPFMTLKPAYQTANVENSPDTPAIGLGSSIVADGVTYGSLTSVTSDTESKQMVRFGWLVALSEGSTLSMTRVGGMVEIQMV